MTRELHYPGAARADLEAATVLGGAGEGMDVEYEVTDWAWDVLGEECRKRGIDCPP